MEPSVELDQLLDRWRREIFGNSSADPVAVLTNIAELIERHTEAYLKLPIDPFDDRHPSRAYPECTLGILLKALFKNENFMTQLTNDYISTRGNFGLNVISCRLLLDILPGLDANVVFGETESLVPKLLEWAEDSPFPLHSYATGLLGAAMEVDEILANHRDQNNKLVPLMLNRLNQLTPISNSSDIDLYSSKGLKRPYSDLEQDDLPIHNECSSSSWAEAHMSGSYQMHPLSTVMQQRFILQYLSALGSPKCQELLVHMFEHKALSYILHFIDGRKNQDIRLAFDALKFLASFLRHKKFALEFLDHGGLFHLLQVNRRGMASSGVAICLFQLAYNEDVLKRICSMDRKTVERMVDYGSWLLERSQYDSSRDHASMFFTLCFQFPILLKLFDRDNGLTKLLNVISMQGNFYDDQQIHGLADDEFSRRHTAKHVCIALKKYTWAHFVSETQKHTRPNLQNNDQDPTSMADENVLEAIDLHREGTVQRFNWRALDRIVYEGGLNNDGGANKLLKIVVHICNESLMPRKSETVRNVLEIFMVCSLSPKVQQLLLKQVIQTNIPYQLDHPSLGVIVMCADSKVLDADCHKAALNILINLACSNIQSQVPLPVFHTPGSGRKRGAPKNPIDMSSALRKSIWANNGTLILPNLLTVTSPLSEADTIRALACRVLCGLAKEESIRQVMSKLPLFTDGQLQSLMREPILTDNRLKHALFCGYCKELIELVTGTPVTYAPGIELSLAEIKRRNIVAQTKIGYVKTGAYHLIYNYLNAEGFTDIATAFYKAANLSSTATKHQIKCAPQPRSPPPSSTSQTSSNRLIRTPAHNTSFSAGNTKSSQMQKSTLQPYHSYKKLHEPSSSTITLDSILTEYLRNQHSLCKHPVSVCPPSDFSDQHRCPEPTNRLSAPFNIASRIIRRRICPPKGGIYGAKYDRHYVYSKFRPVKSVRDPPDFNRSSSTCCAFSRDGHFLFIGTNAGMLKAFNISTGVVEANYDCHINALGYIQASDDDMLLLTTSPDSPTPQCVLWTFTDIFERKYRFENDLHAEFGKASSDKIITTQELYARLWDTATGALIHKYDAHHRYSCNRATLNHNDTLVLNDGVLWDVRNSKDAIHKFGKYNQHINGIFHPNGNEIICNSQIWDVRNFKILKTVPAFDMCQLKFNSMGDVIFATILDDPSDDSAKTRSEFKTSFRTFDSHDYSTIATIDLKRTITDLAVSTGDEHIALIESITAPAFHEEYETDASICRLYEIGRSRYSGDIDLGDEDDDDADDEENEDDDDDDDDEEDDDDDDNVGYDLDEEEGYEIYGSDESELEEVGTDENDIYDGSHLSSSAGTVASRDELVPFSFQHSSEDDEDVDGATSDDNYDPSYGLQ